MKQPEMRSTWLVQRLDPPVGDRGFLGPDNPFAFGGGLRNGGLTEEAMGLLRTIFSFDYMGAAEFEFGEVPRALQGLAKDDRRLTAWSFTIPLAKVARHWTDKSKGEPDGEATVYALARKAQAVEVEKRIRAMAAKDYEFKEATHLPAVLRPAADGERWTPRTAGWLELDNGFMFFVSREMWEATCSLFGVDVPEPVSA